MLVKFTLDKDCFSADALNNDLNTNAHTVLEEYWSKYGVLIYPQQFNILEFLKGLNNQQDKQKWTLMLSNKFFRSIQVDANWESMEDLNNKNPRYNNILDYKNYFEALILDETNFIEFREHEKFQEVINEIEIMPPGNISASSKFINIKNNLESRLEIGQLTEEIWRAKFLDLCKYSHEITIIDRYFFKSLATDLKNGKPSSLEFLLRKIATCREDKCVLTIVSTTTTSDQDSSYEIALNHLKAKGYTNWHDFLYSWVTDLLSPPLSMKLNSFKFIDVAHEFFNIESHDRYFRFDNCYFQIGKGVDFMRFPTQTTRNECSANSNMRCDSFKSHMIINKLSKFL